MEYLTCPKCGVLDNKKHIGTAVTMVCPDCNQGEKNKYHQPLAGLCRECCPTGYGTKN